MELTWPIRIRILAAFAVGILLIGLLCRPLAAPAERLGIIYLQNLTLPGQFYLIALSFLCGVISYFIARPYGKEIGILAVPAGLAILSISWGNLANLMQVNADVQSKLLIYNQLRFEAFFWLLLVLAGFAGVYVSDLLAGVKTEKKEEQDKKIATMNLYINSAIAVIGSVLIAGICIMILAQDVRFSDSKLGSVIAQPVKGQIVFAVVVAFGIVGFLCKKFLNVSYFWPILATAFITYIAIMTYINANTLEYIYNRWPANFFPNPTVSILPIQMVSFGTLGAIWGYWLAVKYELWRHHEQ